MTLVLAALCAVATVACQARVRRTPDDTLVMLFDASIIELDPRYTGGNNDVKLSRLIVPGLTTVARPSLEPAFEMAEAIEQRDERTWDVTLRPGLRFSDGMPVTSEDVVYSFMSMLDPAMKSPYRGNFADRFVRLEALDERRVRFHLTRPLATFLSDLEFGIISASAARRGKDQRFAGNRVIGAGAYRVVSFETDRIMLERNPHYYGRAARMPRIEVRTVRDASARALMLVGGSADLAQNALRLDLVDSVAGRARIHVTSGPSALLSYMMMHNEDPVLRDVRVRRAIAHAIDRERIIAVKLGGRAVLATGVLPPSHWAYEKDVARYAYDPDRARALLDEAGYPDPDGPGPAPRLRLTYKTSSDQFRLAVARIIAAQLGEVGIEVDVRAFEFGTFFADIKRGNYQIATMQTAAITEPDFHHTYFHSSSIPSQENPNDHNRWRYRNARVDELTQAGRNTVDRAERLRIYSELQQIVARELPVIPLWHEDNVAVMNVDVDGYELLPHAGVSGLTSAFKR
ncbi:MAG TPA: ABC transporter substrate-binding protein [Haliangium sp.]|nr:ABC transporter substrate-binding protein [Haliangium sp.]